jgi:hypothetical protein
MQAPGGCIHLLQDNPPTRLDEAAIHGELFGSPTQWPQHKAGVDEIEGLRGQAAVEEVIVDQGHIGQAFLVHKSLGRSQNIVSHI